MKEKTKLQNFYLEENTTSLSKQPRSSLKILGLDTFFTERKKFQKSNESKNRQMAFTCQLYKPRRTKTRQSNYKIWQMCEIAK